jgi:hypothetical protein
MQTYYDPNYGWVTRDASGAVRQATAAEVQAARMQQSDASLAPPQMPPAPTPGPTRNADGSVTPSPTDAGTPTPADASKGVPSAAQTDNWVTNQPWWGTLFPTNTLQRTAYDLDPSFAWATATNELGGNAWAPRYDWMSRQQGRYHTLYGDENTRAQGTPQGDMTFADWIEANQPRFAHDFGMMPAGQKGYTNLFQPAGRQTY